MKNLFILIIILFLFQCSKKPEVLITPMKENIVNQLNFEFEDTDDWMSLTIAGNKVGYSVFSFDTLENNIIRSREFMYMELNAGSKILIVSTKGESFGNSNGFVDSFFYKIESADQLMLLYGLYKNDSLNISILSDNTVKNDVVACSPLPISMVDAVRFFGEDEIITLEIFEPSSQSVIEIEIENIGIDTFPEYGVLNHFRATMFGVPVDLWLDKYEKLIVQEMSALSMKLVSVPRQIAEDMSLSENTQDIYKQFRVDVDKQLINPLSIKYLRIIINDLNQNIASFNQIQNGDTIEIYSSEISTVNSTIPDSVKAYLLPTSLIQCDDTKIINKANSIISPQDNPRIKLEKLNNWVFDNLDKEPTFTVPSATDVLNSKKGDCNEHATLLTALLRAVGIPARITVGIVYANNDGFYYHAWCEAYIGQWVSIDPTFGQMPSDATHIALSRGSSAEQAKIITVMGKISIKLLEQN